MSYHAISAGWTPEYRGHRCELDGIPEHDDILEKLTWLAVSGALCVLLCTALLLLSNQMSVPHPKGNFDSVLRWGCQISQYISGCMVSSQIELGALLEYLRSVVLGQKWRNGPAIFNHTPWCTSDALRGTVLSLWSNNEGCSRNSGTIPG